MKHLKTKLMASVAMLMVATVMISSASFAWFTISTAPETSGVTTGLATNQALEIALATTSGFTSEPAASGQNDTGKNITWGNLVDVSAYFNNSDNKAMLRPCIVGTGDNKGKLMAPLFGADGRTNGVTALSDSYVAVDSTSPTTAYHDGAIKIWAAENSDKTKTIYAYQLDYFMRTNLDDLSISLLETGADRGAGVAGAGTTITSGSKATVQFKVDDGDWITYYDGGADAPAFDFTTPLVADTVANKIYKVSMRVYWDGGNASNADLALTSQECAVNAQFTAGTLTGIGATGDSTVSPKPTKASNPS